MIDDTLKIQRDDEGAANEADTVGSTSKYPRFAISIKDTDEVFCF